MRFNSNCTRCITKWLDTKRETNVKKGQVRETDSRKWLVVTMNVNHDTCLMLSEGGAIRDISANIVDTWKIVTNETEENVFNRVSNNLHKEIE